jgi:7 transmembrane receptor (rhodopsin family)
MMKTAQYASNDFSSMVLPFESIFYKRNINYVLKNDSDLYEDNNYNDTVTTNGNFTITNGTIYVADKSNKDLNNYWALLALILVFGTAGGNILVCLAIAWEKRLQNVTNYFLASLALTDLMVAVLVMPLGIVTLYRGEWA